MIDHIAVNLRTDAIHTASRVFRQKLERVNGSDIWKNALRCLASGS